MTIYVYDTYARTRSGTIMHFDVFVPHQDQAQALQCAKQWLSGIGYPDAQVNPENCAYCHAAAELPDHLRGDMAAHGYAIMKLEGCPQTD